MKHRQYLSLHPIREFQDVLILTKNSPRPPQQINQLFEADCEILKVGRGYLCTSTDSVGEEISIRLYEDPYLWGWMTVMSSVSDLAVSGAQPLGMLLSTQWKFQCPEKIKKQFYRGANAALRASQVGLLGGDSGYSTDHVMTSTILGVSSKKPLTRMGARPGDIVAVVGKAQTGIGPCIAFRYLWANSSDAFPEGLFRPRPQPALIQKLRPLVRASIDTSDGLASCLHIMARLNNIGFDLSWNAALISPKALRFSRSLGLHPLLLWMGDHGDFQSLLFIPKKNWNAAKGLAPDLVPIGSCTARPGDYSVVFGSEKTALPLELVSDCARDAAAIEVNLHRLNDYFWAHLQES